MEEDGSTAAPSAAEEDAAAAAVASWLIVDDDTASELSKLLDLFEAPPPPFRVRFIDNPYSSPVIFQSSSAYVTINGNEESCGSSFSDSDSSVMASIDVGGARAASGAWIAEPGEAREADVGVGFCDDGEDATWLEFLSEFFE